MNPVVRFWTFLRSIFTAGRGGETAYITWKSIPYGVGSFELLRQENGYYVDKPGYLRELKKTPPYLFFIRPRRFGKTLLISMMETYFDIDKAGQFEYYFKGTDIYKNPTAERNSYLILKFDFSEIDASDPSVKKVEESVLNHVKNQVKIFISKYKKQLNQAGLLNITKDGIKQKLSVRYFIQDNEISMTKQ